LLTQDGFGIRAIHPDSTHSFRDFRAGMNNDRWRYMGLLPINASAAINTDGIGYAIPNTRPEDRMALASAGITQDMTRTLRVLPSEMFTIANLPLMVMRWQRGQFTTTSIWPWQPDERHESVIFDFVYTIPWENATVTWTPFGEATRHIGGVFNIDTGSMGQDAMNLGRFTISVNVPVHAGGITYNFAYTLVLEIRNQI
jgi:hypothetical protein